MDKSYVKKGSDHRGSTVFNFRLLKNNCTADIIELKFQTPRMLRIKMYYFMLVTHKQTRAK